jgi:SSS family solute:Na+ symporter
MVYFAYTIRGSMFVVLLLGIYWKKTSENGAIYSMILTGLVGVFWVVFKAITGQYPINPVITETYAAVIAAFVSTIIFSLIFKKTDINKTNSLEGSI